MPPNVPDPQSLFLHQLREMLYVERSLADEVLPSVSKEVENAQLREGLEKHAKQSGQHARSLERAFEILDAEARPEPSHALEGLRKDHDQLASNIGMETLRDLFDAEAIAKSEHLEIAAYRGLIEMAQQMGQTEIQGLLEDNCRQDAETLEQLESMSRQLNRELAGATS
jgi:ferritin-like metal-binding protein YciE